MTTPTARPSSRPADRHSRAALALSLPASWRHTADPECGVLVSARAPTAPASGVRPRVTLRCEPVDTGPARWHEETLTGLSERLVALDVEDEDDYEIGAHEVAYRRYAHRARGVDLLCDEWAWLIDGTGYVLRCTVAREDYPDYCDVFEVVAETFDPAPGRG